MINYYNLKKRIKRNEGFKASYYFDSLGHATIGYGHLIKKNEQHLINKKFSKKFLLNLFESDFKKAVLDYNRNYLKNRFEKNIQYFLIEMIFQLGIVGQKKFKKMNYYLKKRSVYMACLEMKDSLWYKQTPKRVDFLIGILLK